MLQLKVGVVAVPAMEPLPTQLATQVVAALAAASVPRHAVGVGESLAAVPTRVRLPPGTRGTTGGGGGCGAFETWWRVWVDESAGVVGSGSGWDS